MCYNDSAKKDIFDILGISGREDSYTDLINSVFEISKVFKENLLKKFFVGNSDIEKLKMKIRSCYFTPEGSRKKIIPDIILYNDNKIVIIEVKIFSGEGENQLKRYDEGLNEIKFKDIDNEDFDNEVIDKDLISGENNYDIHYEIKIIGKSKIEFRIDYHTNPYLTSNEIKTYELNHLYDDRKKIIQKWKERYKNEDGIVSKAQGKALYVYKKTYEIKDEWTVKDFKSKIYSLIESNKKKVDNLLSIINETLIKDTKNM